MYVVFYGDHPDFIEYEFSRHRTRAAAEKAITRARKDPYWRTHFFRITPAVSSEVTAPASLHPDYYNPTSAKEVWHEE